MNETKRNDIKINGSGKASGGFYNNVVINGSGEINGNIECFNFKVNGSGSINGNVKSENSVISGSAHLKGDIVSEEFKVNGSAKVSGNSISKFTKINGSIDINGFLNGEELQIRGSVKIGGDCNVEKFDSKGGFSISGLLSADEISAEIYGTCKAKEIGGEKINVSLGHSFGIKKLLNAILNLLDLKQVLIADVIEGDDIFLENTIVKTVRGNNVVIGDGCEIDLIEYKTNFHCNGNSNIKENKKTIV
jgi:cytoskeletal protein CcmA (bactofilin family)